MMDGGHMRRGLGPLSREVPVVPEHENPTVSIVVLNHRRPRLLARVVAGIAQLDYDNFEVVVVGDQPMLEDYCLPRGWAGRIRYRSFQKPNICCSRNIGIEASAGDIVAFIDDDAVPEPNWLRNLVLPFQAPTVGAVAGSVWAANGTTIEWQGGHFDRTGIEQPQRFSPGVTIVDAQTQLETGDFLSLMGVNTAFRRRALLDIGGFDQAYRYFLDETDVALRLAEAGWDAALSTGAEVHHLREENAARNRVRVPRSLFEIAASTAYFCRRHLPIAQRDQALADFRKARLADLDPFTRLGLLRGAERRMLVSQMEQGLQEGIKRQPDLPLDDNVPSPNFLPFAGHVDTPPLRIALVSGWGLGSVRRMRALATDLAKAGHFTTCISYLSGPQPRQINFCDGVWVHSGGTWRLDQRNRGGRIITRRARARVDLASSDRKRHFDVVISSGGGFSAKGIQPLTLEHPSVGGRLVLERVDGRGRANVHQLEDIRGLLAEALDRQSYDLETSSGSKTRGADTLQASKDSLCPDPQPTPRSKRA